MNPTAGIVVTTIVEADPDTAFSIFTSEIDAWWQRGPKFRPSMGKEGVLRFEPQVGGRLLEEYRDGSAFEFGRIRVWEPGRRLVFDMMARSFAPGESTEVEVRFEAEGNQTRVTLENRGWEKFPQEHPVRHGIGEPAFRDAMRTWWQEVLASVQGHIERSTSGA